MARVYIGLGSNLGDRLATLRQAVDALGALGTVILRSSVWETEAVGPPPDYLNAVVALDTALLPGALLDALLSIELRHGRVRSVLNAPRTLDLDLLLYDDRQIALPSLTVPHPRLAEREFVLAPLAEIAPLLLHPVLQCSMAELRAALPKRLRVRRVPARL